MAEEELMEAREKRNLDDARYIVKDSEGYYRWTYEVDSSSNRSFLNMYLIIKIRSICLA